MRSHNLVTNSYCVSGHAQLQKALPLWKHPPWYENYNWHKPEPAKEDDPWEDLPKETQWKWGKEFYEEQQMLIRQHGYAQDHLQGKK